MKTTKHIAEVPVSGVEVVIEGPLTRLFFDFQNPVPREGDPADLKVCESIDVYGREYGQMVSAIINDKYNADSTQALTANYELAKDSKSGLTPEKKAEYLAEYAAYQTWRAHAKEIARAAETEIANHPTEI